MDGMRELAVNDQGEAVLFQTGPVEPPPAVARFAVGARVLELVGADGHIDVVSDGIDPALAEFLVLAERLIVCRIERGVPVEGYDVSVEVDHDR